MSEQYDPYLIQAPRAELLEDFYQLMQSIDAIGDMKQMLMDMEEFEAWAELCALEYSLRKTPASD